ncbi:hypothetical protein MTR_7g075810 [Medicago truncatula]|uniref:Uncharacterized protein n=1 Tax=Medicago truncatula TaxID=3880 RepID=G7L1E9_MEDTR|nr:hypothetical protein MTR_7g075810 [Medicago truncatula]
MASWKRVRDGLSASARHEVALGSPDIVGEFGDRFGALNTLINYDLETCLGMIICLGARYLLSRIFEVVTPAMCVEYFSAICFLPVVAPLLVLQNCAFSNMLGAFLVRSILFLVEHSSEYYCYKFEHSSAQVNWGTKVAAEKAIVEWQRPSLEEMRLLRSLVNNVDLWLLYLY